MEVWNWNLKKIICNFYFIKCQKLNKFKNGVDFSSNLDNAQKSLAKVMNHRIEKLLSLVDANQPQSNVANLSEISNEHEISLNETSDNNSCSSTIKVEPLSMLISKRFKSNSSNRKHKCETNLKCANGAYRFEFNVCESISNFKINMNYDLNSRSVAKRPFSEYIHVNKYICSNKILWQLLCPAIASRISPFTFIFLFA